MNGKKKIVFLAVVILFSTSVFGQNEIGPEGDKLVWVFLIVLLAISGIWIGSKRKRKKKTNRSQTDKKGQIELELEKDAIYYPDNLKLKITNKGNWDIDLDRPLLIFDNFWLKRKFRIKGMANRTFYPLYLEKGKTHTLQIDLTRFYSHDKHLRKYPKAMIYVYDVKGRRLGRKSVFLRKTLIRF